MDGRNIVSVHNLRKKPREILDFPYATSESHVRNHILRGKSSEKPLGHGLSEAHNMRKKSRGILKTENPKTEYGFHFADPPPTHIFKGERASLYEKTAFPSRSASRSLAYIAFCSDFRKNARNRRHHHRFCGLSVSSPNIRVHGKAFSQSETRGTSPFSSKALRLEMADRCISRTYSQKAQSSAVSG